MQLINTDFIFAVAAITDLLANTWTTPENRVTGGICSGSCPTEERPCYSVTWGLAHPVQLTLHEDGAMSMYVADDCSELPAHSMYAMLGYAEYHDIRIEEVGPGDECSKCAAAIAACDERRRQHAEKKAQEA